MDDGKMIVVIRTDLNCRFVKVKCMIQGCIQRRGGFWGSKASPF